MKLRKYRLPILILFFFAIGYSAYLIIENSYIKGMPYFSTSYKESKDKGVFISLLPADNTKYRLSFQPWIEKAWYRQTSILGTKMVKYRQNEYNLLYPYSVYESGNQYGLRYLGDSKRDAGSEKDSVQLSSLTGIPNSIKLYIEKQGKIIDSLDLYVKGVFDKK